jgi:hypothetical protein
MAKNTSCITVKAKDVPTIIGMIARGDRHHDIAAWFGINQGRIKDAQDGKYGPPQTTAGLTLPPKGPPGIKGRRLREAANSVMGHLLASDFQAALAALRTAMGNYDADEA